MKTKLFFIYLLVCSNLLVAQQEEQKHIALKCDVLGVVSKQISFGVEYLPSSSVGLEFGFLYDNNKIGIDKPRGLLFFIPNVEYYTFNTFSFLGDVRLYINPKEDKRCVFFGAFSFAYTHLHRIDKAYYDDFREIRNEEPVNIADYYPMFRFGLMAGAKIKLGSKLYLEPSLKYLRAHSEELPDLGCSNSNVRGRVFSIHSKLVYQIAVR